MRTIFLKCYDKTKLILNFATVIKENNSIFRAAAIAVMLMIMAVTSFAAKSFTLVIDAGHGGHDAGARGSFSNEKDINLRTALAFGRYVEKNCPDVNVIYTRKTDVFIPLHKRADIANKNKADVFISIHTNALPAGRIARGVETYTMGMRRSNEKLSAAQRENAVITYESDYKQRYEGYDPNSPESAIMFEFIHDKNMAKSVELARLVQKNVCSIASRPDKGVKQDVFLVLRETSMPACLIELGFITTPDEERLLNDEASVDNIARGIYNAFAKYKNDNFSGFTVPYEAKGSQEVKVPSIVPQDFKEDNVAPRAKKRTRAVPQSVKSKVADNDDREEKAEKIIDRKKATENAVSEQSVTRAVKPVARGRNENASKSSQTTKTDNKVADSDGKPVFKVQILASNVVLPSNSKRLKGQNGVSSYKEGGMYKYTVGESTNYSEINKMRQSLAEQFPGCFVVAFKNGEKVNVNEAIKESRRRK